MANLTPEPGNRSIQAMSLIPTSMPTLNSVRRLAILLLLVPALAACGQSRPNEP
jgi:hypothetical protein